MSLPSVAALVEAVERGRLLDDRQGEELRQEIGPRFTDPLALAHELVRRGWLTPYQVNQLYLGDSGLLAVGPYQLLQRLGEGGMGQVFLARHVRLGRRVALKVVRKERLVKPEILGLFHREIQAAARLSHPNIVRALDAGQEGDTHYFVMEYVAGTDLGRLVRRRGFLNVAEACDYARQAALGLQHAFERGLVHRDVRPENLMLTPPSHGGDLNTSPPSQGGNLNTSPPCERGDRGGVVKLLDMGLARLRAEGEVAGEDKVVGSADYIAPEQILDSRAVDTRADLYSLGCTLYHLLTGRVPFPGGTVKQKLRRHRRREPVPVEKLRPEVPLAVSAVIRKLMAKRPDDRFQTPAEAAEALADLEGELRSAKLTSFLGLGPLPPPRSRRPGRRLLLLLAWVLLLVVLAGLLGVVLGWYSALWAGGELPD
jgi:serine/threonine-protein kinase